MGQAAGGKYVDVGVALGEKAHRRVEVPGGCQRDFRQVGPQSELRAPTACFGVAKQQGRVVAAQGFGPGENCVVFGPEPIDFGHVLGRRNQQPPGRAVVHEAVGRDGSGEGYEHRRRVMSVISGQAPSRMG